MGAEVEVGDGESVAVLGSDSLDVGGFVSSAGGGFFLNTPRKYKKFEIRV